MSKLTKTPCGVVDKVAVGSFKVKVCTPVTQLSSLLD